ncbi:MAG: PAS domain S-box protein [Ferruginibacter sp.]
MEQLEESNAVNDVKSAFYYRMMIGFIAAILFILVIALISVYYTNRVSGSARWVEHTITVLNQAEHTSSLTNDIENGANGYMLTANKNYLTLFTLGKDSIYNDLQKLKALTKDNPSQQIRIDSLSKLVEKIINNSSEEIGLRKKGTGNAPQISYMDKGPIFSNQTRKLLSDIKTEENRLLLLRHNENKKDGAVFRMVYYTLLGYVFIALVILVIALRMNVSTIIKAQQSAQKNMKEINDYKSALDESSIVAITDQKGIIQHVNDNFCKISKYTPEEIFGRDHRIVNSGYHSKKVFEDLWTTISKGSRWKGELKNKAKDGALYWVDTTIVPFLNKDGNPYQYAAINTDITARKFAEEENAKSETRFRETLDNMLEGVQIIGFDWRYIYVNDSFLKHARYTREELLGHTIMEMYPGIELLPVYQQYKHCFSERVSIQLENEFVFPNGAVEWFELSFQPVPEGISILSVDITQRKKLQQQQALMASIVNLSEDAIISKNLDGIVTSWNKGAEKIFGYSSENIVNKHISTLIPSDLRQEENEIMHRIKKGEIFDSYETLRIRQDGAVINVSFTISPITDSVGNITGASKIARDITGRIKTEQALLFSEAKFKSIFDAKMGGIIFWNECGNILEANDRFLEIFGYTRQDLDEGKVDWNKMTPPEYAYLDDLALKHIKMTGNCPPFEKEYFHKDGSRVSIIVSASSLNSGNSIEGVAFINDITKRKVAEQEIRKLNEELHLSEKKFRALIENSADIVFICDDKLTPIYRSPASERITGFTNKEQVEMGSLATAHPEDAEMLKALAGEVLKNPGKPFPVSFRTMHKKGHYVYVEGVITNMLNNDAIKGIVANFRDVSDARKAEEKIRQSEGIYKTIASSIPGSVIVLVDTDYRYFLIEGDMLEQLGYSKDQLFGKKLSEALKPERYAEVLPDFKRVFAGESFTINAERGGYHTISRYVPLTDDTNTVYAAMVVLIDVTELKKAELHIAELNIGLEQKVIQRTAQLEALNNELEAFSYSISHDLRAPLRIIDGFGEILLEDYFENLDEEGRKTVNVMMSSAKKMGRLIDDLLRFSKLGRVSMRMSELDMNKLVKEVLKDLENGGMPIPVNLKTFHLEPAVADHSLLKQVWINLISNAIKYSGAKANPSIEIGMAQDKYTYYIKDNGAGFDMHYVDKLFGVFQRLHREEEFAGTGVGLALVQRIIFKHEGTIWAEAVVDKGATFYFTLPPQAIV